MCVHHDSSRNPGSLSCWGNGVWGTRSCGDSDLALCKPFLLLEGSLSLDTSSDDLVHKDPLLDHKVAGRNIEVDNSRLQGPTGHRSWNSRTRSCWCRTAAARRTPDPHCSCPHPLSKGFLPRGGGSSVSRHCRLSALLATLPTRPLLPHLCQCLPVQSPLKKGFFLLEISSQRLTWASWQLVLGEFGSQRKALQT